MTEPSQYFKGRTVQEQMNEVIGYVDARAEEVAAAKADDVLEPAEQAKTDAIAAKEAAEDARDATLAALPAIQQDIADLKAEDVSLDGRLNTVELKVQTAEGNIVTIQGQIVALQTADEKNVKINNINQYAVGLTGIQTAAGPKIFTSPFTVNSDGTATAFFVKTRGNHRIIQLNAKDYDVTDGAAHYLPSVLSFCDKNDVVLFRIGAYSFTNGRVQIKIYARNSDGSYKESILIEGDTI